MNNRNCDEERKQAFQKGKRVGIWLMKNESKWRKDVKQRERRKDVAVMREQEGAMEGLSDIFGRAEQQQRAVPPPVSTLSAPLAPQRVPQPAPSPVPSARQRLAILYTDERIRGMNKDEAREALRALGGNPRREGSKDYRPAEEVRELIRQKRRVIQG